MLFDTSVAIPDSCTTHLNWAFTTGKDKGFYQDMIFVCGVRPLDATQNDFQRYFKCKSIHPEDCNDEGLEFPTSCSVPPCDQCSRGRIYNSINCYYDLYNNILQINYELINYDNIILT